MFIKRPQNNNNNNIFHVSDSITSPEPSQHDFIICTYRERALAVFPPKIHFLLFFPFILPVLLACSGAQEYLHVFWRCRLSFQVTSGSPISQQHWLTDPTFFSNALKCVCIVSGCQVLSFPPLYLAHFFPSSFPLTFVLPPPPESFSLHLLWLSLPFLCHPIYLPALHFSLSISPFIPIFFPLSFLASELKINLNGWGHGELSTLRSYGCYRLSLQLRMRLSGNSVFCILRRKLKD